MTSGPKAPTGAARRRTRISDAETERRMLDTAVQLIMQRGMTVSLEHLSVEEIIQAAGVARTSVYRRWPYKDLFFSDLLVEVAKATQLGTGYGSVPAWPSTWKRCCRGRLAWILNRTARTSPWRSCE